MPRIRVLPEILANKIAAGEIVERPASVIKELLENSLDAGSCKIVVEVSHGGRQFMRVQDDGAGMSHDDSILAFEHHATSKLKEAADLFAIATLGFRGEALPSIASVSRLTLRSIDALAAGPTSNVGTEVFIRGGVMKSVKNIPWVKGTDITVRDLFFNVPARRKFLKSNDTELGHITRLVTHYALANPTVAFKFLHNGHDVFTHEATSELKARLYQVLGAQHLEHLVPILGEREDHRIRGYISKPHEHRSNPHSQYFFVNKRLVKDRLIAHAVHQAYGPSLPKGTYPIAVIFVDAPPSEIDVNVHPAKTEIRFRKAHVVHDLIRVSLEDSLLKAQPMPRFHLPGAEARFRQEAVGKGTAGEQPAPPPASLSVSGKSGRTDGVLPYQKSTIKPLPHGSLVIEPSSNDLDCGKSRVVHEQQLTQSTPYWAGRAHNPLRPLAQFANTYILASDNEGLVIVDQHVAHERILFEQLLDRIQKKDAVRQRLLLPLTFDLTPTQEAVFEQIQNDLIAMGFEVEQFGGRTITVKAVPATLTKGDYRQLILETLEGLDNQTGQLALVDLQRNMAAGLACRAAVKANMPMNLEKMTWLVDQLAQTRFPHACPHGRPIQMRLTLREIERRFKRI